MAIMRVFILASIAMVSPTAASVNFEMLEIAFSRLQELKNKVQLPQADNFLSQVVTRTNVTGQACEFCVDFGDKALKELEDYLEKTGVATACDDLCSQLSSPAAQQMCEVFCAKVGIEALVKILKDTDFDIFYFCDMVEACPAGPDGASISIGKAVAEPPSVARAGSVQLSVSLEVGIPSGPGEFYVEVSKPGTAKIAKIHQFLLEGIPAGTRGLSVRWTDTTLPGKYDFVFKVCQGECGSKHPHSKTLGESCGSFNVTTGEEVLV